MNTIHPRVDKTIITKLYEIFSDSASYDAERIYGEKFYDDSEKMSTLIGHIEHLRHKYCIYDCDNIFCAMITDKIGIEKISQYMLPNVCKTFLELAKSCDRSTLIKVEHYNVVKLIDDILMNQYCNEYGKCVRNENISVNSIEFEMTDTRNFSKFGSHLKYGPWLLFEYVVKKLAPPKNVVIPQKLIVSENSTDKKQYEDLKRRLEFVEFYCFAMFIIIFFQLTF